MTKDTMKAYTEIDCILSNMPNEYVLKVPKKLREKFRNEKDHDYLFRLEENKRLNEHNLSRKTRALLAMLKYNYWCNDYEEQQELAKLFSDNQKKHEEYIREIYNPDNIFKNKNIDSLKNEQNLPIEQKEKSIFSRIIDFIKLKIFKR